MDALTPAEVRVLGVLVEKELSTPEYYPLTIKALTAGCNQRSNRHPVVEYSEDDVRDALAALQRRRLAGTAGGAYSRAAKYRHALAEAYDLDVPARAVLASLLLRGPQTVGELRGRTSRMYAFDDLDAVQAQLTALAERGEPLVAELPRGPGQKEARYAHLLAGAPEPEPEAAPVPIAATPTAERVDRLEDEVQALADRLAALEDAFATFRSQFE